MSSHIVLLGILLLLSAFFSGSESALFSLSRLQIQRIKKENRERGSAVSQLTSDPHKLLTAILLGNTFVNVTFAIVIGDLTTNAFGKGIGATIGIIVATFMLLIFGEITPKTYALTHSESISLKAAPILLWFSSLILPIRALFDRAVKLFVIFIGGSSKSKEDEVSTEEFKAMLDSSEAEGAIKKQESQLLHNILMLPSIEARQIMIPALKMVCADINLSIKEVLALAQRHGHSRIPVYKGNVNRIGGIFHVKDLPQWNSYDIDLKSIEEFMKLRYKYKLTPDQKETLIRPPFFASERVKVSTLMRDLLDRKTHMAVLLDDRGNTSGLITIEDIIEELVGEISDEYDYH